MYAIWASGHAAARGQAAQGVAGPHGVAAHGRGGRAAPAAPDPVASVGAPEAGMRRREPASTKEVGLRPLAAASAAVLTPLATAMPESVSPGLHETATGPPEAVAADGAAVTGVAEPAPGAGTCRVVPDTTKAVGERPLAAASAPVGRPLAAAIPDSVSPGSDRVRGAEGGRRGSQGAGQGGRGEHVSDSSHACT